MLGFVQQLIVTNIFIDMPTKQVFTYDEKGLSLIKYNDIYKQ